MKYLWAAVMALVLAGCASVPQSQAIKIPFITPQERLLTADPNFLIIIGNKEFLDDAEHWKIEVRRRFKTEKVVMYFGHGNATLTNDWNAYPDKFGRIQSVREFASKLHDRFPDHIIVLICCNPAGHDLWIPNVYYAKASVWVMPDKDCTPHTLTDAEWVQNMTYELTGIGHIIRETDRNSFSVGSIEEFTTQGK
jgi:hypothetical protein